MNPLLDKAYDDTDNEVKEIDNVRLIMEKKGVREQDVWNVWNIISIVGSIFLILGILLI